MNNVTSDGKGIGDGSPKGTGPSCCQPADGQESRCCGPQSRCKGKALIAALIIMTAIGVGAVSLMRGNAAQPVTATPTSCPPSQCGATCNTDCAK